VVSLEDASAGAFLKNISIVGGGWAGLAAAVRAVSSGWKVSLYEAAPQLGGRARKVVRNELHLDNGQHILIGAYRDTLALMRTVGVDIEGSLWRMPLALKYFDGSGIQLKNIPAPINVLVGVLNATGWSWPDKGRFLWQTMQWQRQQFHCDPALSVTDICTGVPPVIMRQLVEPLCVSALNLPCNKANAQIFLRVLKDALLGEAGSSDMLIPRVDQSQLLPDKALEWLMQHGAQVFTHQRIADLRELPPSHKVLACPAWEAAALVSHLNPSWASQALGMRHTSIATVYLQTNDAIDWPLPLMALNSHATAPAQFAFDKGRISQRSEMQGVIAMVVSNSTDDKDALTQSVVRQAHEELGLKSLKTLLTVVEKRAAFACTPELFRPSMHIHDRVVACGDYIAGPYPSTLEAAVRSGIQVIDFLNNSALDENSV
jgi:squalene-associated FAD-dependent desaturase